MLHRREDLDGHLFAGFEIFSGDAAIDGGHSAFAQKRGQEILTQALAQNAVPGFVRFRLQFLQKRDSLLSRFLVLDLLSDQ